jgi:signal transduction histidine kinase
MVLQGKMAGLGSLTAGVAHEINNPATFVHVAAQNQRADLEQFEEFVLGLVEADAAPEILDDFQQHFARLNENVATMLNGTGRIKGIVRDLRAFTRIDSEDPQMVDLADCLLSTLNLVRTSWQQKVEFVTELEAVPKIACWPALINQVFMNLLVNGCQAIEEKRKAEGAPGAERSKLWLRLFRHEGLLVIEFEDSGIGITPAQQARIMEPFYTTKTVGQGTGLGLSIAFGIVQKHGGHLGFTSLPGQGSCFTIHLPLSPVSPVSPVLPVAGASALKE